MARPKLTLTARQDQRLAMTLLMQQSLKILQMPRLELEAYLRQEIEANPLLDEAPVALDSPHYFEHLVTKPLSLHEHLMRQAQQAFSGDELLTASAIIGSLDKKGFYKETPLLAETPVLKVIQRFDPVGVGAKDAREALLIQLDELDKSHTFLYRLIDKRYDYFLKNKFLPNERAAMKDDLVGLTPFPGLSFDPEPSFTHLPDLILADEGELSHPLSFSLIRNPLPPLDMMTSEEQKCLNKYSTAISGLERALKARSETLKKVALFILSKNEPFFTGKSTVHSTLTIQQVAHELNLSHSTVARAVANKYWQTPLGLFPLQLFFQKKTEPKVVLEELICSEERPFTDEELVKKLEERGYHISRRCVAKYRRELNIPSSHTRERH